MMGGLSYAKWVTADNGMVGYMDPKGAGATVTGKNDHYTYHPAVMSSLGMCVRIFSEHNPDDPFLELAAKQESEEGDAPWPPHYKKQPGEKKRVQPSRSKTEERHAKHPLIVIAQAADKEDALAGLERWKAKHPDVSAKLGTDDVLVDAMRGRHKTWTRIRVNLRNVPEAERPAQATPDPDYDARVEWGVKASERRPPE